ncbi:hypothetical protein EVAR_93043_1 [Eumeta japonica]|uniref:Uncharacterized protein n=1 Tax=Eumeta variegata TaxID=151549 RepID=A0A4C1TI09_EUMVA|nr:hypothetical protein EVAR_93043_1 [Eumeta japonica]
MVEWERDARHSADLSRSQEDGIKRYKSTGAPTRIGNYICHCRLLRNFSEERAGHLAVITPAVSSGVAEVNTIVYPRPVWPRARFVSRLSHRGDVGAHDERRGGADDGFRMGRGWEIKPALVASLT